MKQKWILLLCSLLLLSGCWDKKELNEVAVVIGAGVDKADDQGYKITAQVIKPQPSKQGGSGGSELPTWSLSANGNTIMDAVRNLNQIAPRRIYWPHMQIIVFGEELAREGISPVLTWFERDRDSRSGTYIIVTKGKAEDLLNQKIELGNVPAKAIADLLDTSELRQIDARRTTLRDLMNVLTSPGVDPTLDVINPKKIRGKVETYELSDVAVMKGDKLVDFIEGTETLGVDVVFKKFKYGIMTIPLDQEDEFFSYQVTDLKNNIRTSVKNDQITVSMKIFIEGNLSDQTGGQDLIDPDNMNQVEKLVETKVKKSIQGIFSQSAEHGADIFGIGRDVRRYHPKAWRKMGRDWDTHLKQVALNIEVKSSIRRSGLILEPTTTKMK
ncbi:Ger(x)C family spore germination protein [Ammoniphilus sp. YIM 78166]|uniref:Ger(x)C family spore germination protein n=1 Tax=Ammoniphilus sp. YIM 78166 TaxID=1644106 RepID=UPI00106FC0EF|nr:Ger(x)C family spore germination protein [Ammoniphilus sp. YIM 78166]